ncbi:MAG: aldo/keto reductase [Alphaproteobacteria bacterium]|nr:aldo/keto reductase [Alphaproteobacteria bacterium]MCB9795391.1 aldo/keto reductase [Alphaproteobacteria bacterium]
MKSLTLPRSSMPALGFGTWLLPGELCEEGVAHALELGYRHVDTARVYNNEVEVGRALAASAVPRDEVFLTTKVWRTDLAAPREALEASLERLGQDYVDLILIHWPNPEQPLEATLEALFQAREDGLTREVGVSNFTLPLLEQALAVGPIAANQVEYHPFLDQSALLGLCQARGVTLTAYCPLAQGAVFDDPVLAEIAEAHGVSAAAVSLAWLLAQEGVSALSRSKSARRRVDNLEAASLRLSEEELARVSALGTQGLRTCDPPWSPAWD